MTSTLFTPYTIAAATTKILDTLGWLPSRNMNRFNLIAVDESGLTGGSTVALEFSPDLGTTWLPINGLGTLTKAGGPYQVQIPYDKLRLNVGGSGGTCKAWAS